jgi:hypothetical protein
MSGLALEEFKTEQRKEKDERKKIKKEINQRKLVLRELLKLHKKKEQDKERDLHIVLQTRFAALQTKFEVLVFDHAALQIKFDILVFDHAALQIKFDILVFDHAALQTKFDVLVFDHAALQTKCDHLQELTIRLNNENSDIKNSIIELKCDFRQKKRDLTEKLTHMENELVLARQINFKKVNDLTTELEDLKVKVLLLFAVKRRKIIKEIEKKISKLSYLKIFDSNIVEILTDRETTLLYNIGKDAGDTVAHGPIDKVELGLLKESCIGDARWLKLFSLAFEMTFDYMKTKVGEKLNVDDNSSENVKFFEKNNNILIDNNNNIMIDKNNNNNNNNNNNVEISKGSNK